MRIQEVIRKTGLSRRTIYYYIGQKLITPDINKNNGYHIFSETDIQKLFLIRKPERGRTSTGRYPVHSCAAAHHTFLSAQAAE